MTESEVRIERMRPDQLDEACQNKPVAYFPLGSLEFHGRHLPVGVDALKAHDLACRAAHRFGGLVVPPLYHGQGGEHGEFLWTWMTDMETMVSLVLSTVRGLERNGIKLIVLLCGHYPNISVGEAVIEQFKQSGGTANVVVMRDYEGFSYPESPLQGDHASKCETSFMLATLESSVDLTALAENREGKPLSDFPLPESSMEGGWWFEKDPAHPWFGLAGQLEYSPMDSTKELGEWAQERFLDYIGGVIAEELPG